MDFVTPNSYLGTILTDLKTADLNNLTIFLLKAHLTPDPAKLIAELVANEANFDGYAAKTAQALSANITNPDGGVEAVTGNQLWISTGSVTPNQIYGWAVCNAAATVLYWWGNFDAPVQIAAAGDAVSLVLSVGPLGLVGKGTITD